MEKTKRLFDEDAYKKTFEANVIECISEKDYYKLVLDQTIFFPEGGGQSSDKGIINDIEVFDVQEKDGVIYHYVKEKINENKVTGEINWDMRYDKMQNHSGEHILSGLIHNKFGYTNVGFHLSNDNEVTFDFDGVISDEDMKEIEDEANKIIYENVPITATIYNGDILKEMDYRSKLDLTKNVRLVKIGDYDLCACCAPHVHSTTEIGIIKILKFESYKGGVRIHMLAGNRAYNDYKIKNDIVNYLTKDLSANQDSLLANYQKKLDEITKAKEETISVKNKLYNMIVDNINLDSEKVLYVSEELDANDLREIGNLLMQKTNKLIGLFSHMQDKFMYVICSSEIDTKECVKNLNEKLNGKGGGKPNMATGSVVCQKEDIINYFK